MIDHFASKKAIQAIRAIILSNHSSGKFFFNGASNHFTAIILAGENFQRQHEKTIISVKIVVPPRNINVSFLWSSVLRYRFSFSQPSTQKVFVLPTRFLFALTRPRPDCAFLSRPAVRTRCLSGGTFEPEGGWPSLYFRGFRTGCWGRGGGVISVETPLLGESSMPSAH